MTARTYAIRCARCCQPKYPMLAAPPPRGWTCVLCTVSGDDSVTLRRARAARGREKASERSTLPVSARSATSTHVEVAGRGVCP